MSRWYPERRVLPVSVFSVRTVVLPVVQINAPAAVLRIHVLYVIPDVRTGVTVPPVLPYVRTPAQEDVLPGRRPAKSAAVSPELSKSRIYDRSQQAAGTVQDYPPLRLT